MCSSLYGMSHTSTAYSQFLVASFSSSSANSACLQNVAFSAAPFDGYFFVVLKIDLARAADHDDAPCLALDSVNQEVR